MAGVPRPLDGELSRLLFRPAGRARPERAQPAGERGQESGRRTGRARHSHLRNRIAGPRFARTGPAAAAEGGEAVIGRPRAAGRRCRDGPGSARRGRRDAGHADHQLADPLGPVGLPSAGRRGRARLGRPPAPRSWRAGPSMSTARCADAPLPVRRETSTPASSAGRTRPSFWRWTAGTAPPRTWNPRHVAGPCRPFSTTAWSGSRPSTEQHWRHEHGQGSGRHLGQGRRRQDDLDRRARGGAGADRAEGGAHRLRCRSAGISTSSWAPSGAWSSTSST